MILFLTINFTLYTKWQKPYPQLCSTTMQGAVSIGSLISQFKKDLGTEPQELALFLDCINYGFDYNLADLFWRSVEVTPRISSYIKANLVTLCNKFAGYYIFHKCCSISVIRIIWSNMLWNQLICNFPFPRTINILSTFSPLPFISNTKRHVCHCV